MQAQAIPLRRVILAGLIGNVMEWYDFAIYGYFAAIIGTQFFPSSDPRNSLLAAFGAFAAGFLVRPLGGVVLGSVADRLGRQRALMVSVLAMAAATVLMAILPSYSRIGLAAPLLMVLLRILQGLSAGGEYSTSIVFLAEHAPAGRRGLVAIWGLWGSVLGILLGSGVGALLAACSVQLLYRSFSRSKSVITSREVPRPHQAFEPAGWFIVRLCSVPALV